MSRPVRDLATGLLAPARNRWGDAVLTTVGAFVLIAVQLAWRASMTARSWFMWDDYIFLSDIARGEADGASWFLAPHFGILMPLGMGLTKLVGWAGFQWSVIAWQIVILQLLAAVACWWMLRTVFGSRPLILVPLLLYLTSPLTAEASVWWSVAINQFPHHILLFASIAAQVSWLRNGKWYQAALVVLTVLLAMASYPKGVLLPFLLLAITVTWFGGTTVRERWRSAARDWPLWSVLALAVAGYAYLWSQNDAGTVASRICTAPAALSASVLQNVGPGLLGGPWRWRLWGPGFDPALVNSSCRPLIYDGPEDLVTGGAPQSLADPPLLLIALVWLTIAAVVLWTLGRRRHALASAWLVAGYLACSVLLVFFGRVALFGPAVSALEPRYFSDLAALMAFALATAVMAMPGASVAPAPRARPILRVVPPRHWASVLVTFIAVSGILSTALYVVPWHERWSDDQFPERYFITNVVEQVEALDPGERVVVADTRLPWRVGTVIDPYNTVRYKLAPLAPRLTATRAGTDLLTLDDDGWLAKASVDGGNRTDPGPDGACGYGVVTSRVIPIVPVMAGSWWIEIGYLAARDGTVTVTVGDTARDATVKSGPHRLFVQVDESFDSVILTSLDGVGLCVDSIAVGTMEPGEDA